MSAFNTNRGGFIIRVSANPSNPCRVKTDAQARQSFRGTQPSRVIVRRDGKVIRRLG